MLTQRPYFRNSGGIHKAVVYLIQIAVIYNINYLRSEKPLMGFFRVEATPLSKLRSTMFLA
jgi:hypothetical protein